MTAWVWATLTLGGLAALLARPHPARRHVVPLHRSVDDAPGERRRSGRPGARFRLTRVHEPADRVGAYVVGVTPPSLALPARAVGWAVIVSGGMVFVHLLGAAVVAVATISAGWVRERRRAAAEYRATVAECASIASLLSVAVGCGLTPRLALEELASFTRGHLSTPNGQLAEALRAGMPLEASVRSWRAAVGDPAHALARLLIGATRDGVAAANALDDLAATLRLQQRRSAEERARRLPVTLLLPLVACILPAFVLLTIIPMVASGLNSLTFPS